LQPVETYQQLEAILRAATPLQSYKFHVHNERRTVERAAAAAASPTAPRGGDLLPSGPHPLRAL
jgi:hypothetical protein